MLAVSASLARPEPAGEHEMPGPPTRGEPQGRAEEMGAGTGSHPRVQRPHGRAQSQGYPPGSAGGGGECDWPRPALSTKQLKNQSGSPNPWEVAEVIHNNSIPAPQSPRG